MRPYRLNQLGIIVNDQYHWYAVGPNEDAGSENFCVLIVAQKVEATGGQESL